jgi:hypothetical protein
VQELDLGQLLSTEEEKNVGASSGTGDEDQKQKSKHGK